MRSASRWIYVAVGCVVLLFSGLVYAWSVLSGPIAAEFPAGHRTAFPDLYDRDELFLPWRPDLRRGFRAHFPREYSSGYPPCCFWRASC